jgi:integrase-like protein
MNTRLETAPARTAGVAAMSVPAMSVPAWRREAAGRRFPARPAIIDWPATGLSRDRVLAQLTAPPFTLAAPSGAKLRRSGTLMLLDWLTDQPGRTWQQRWLESGAEQAGPGWRRVIARWLAVRGLHAQWREYAVSGAVAAAISADVLRPSIRWLAGGGTGQGVLVRTLARARDPHGFARLRELGAADRAIRPADARLGLHRAALILAAKGGTVGDITVGDVLELLDAEAATHRKVAAGTTVFYALLHRLGVFGADAPESLRAVRAMGQRTPEELIDRYGLSCRPIRNLLVDYLRERQPALDYASLKSLSYYLGKCFWQDLEHHHPGIDSLRLAPEVAEAWKYRLRTKTGTVTGPDGDTSEIRVERINYRECLTPVRAFYLDLAQWALEDPARWGPWVAPSPVRGEEVHRRKAALSRKARMDARTRDRLPVLPVLVASVDRHRRDAGALLQAARQTAPGNPIPAPATTLVRAAVPHGTAGKIWAEDPDTGKRRDLGREEHQAFWAWAAVEVLRATGVRIEELLELSHHSLVRYRLPSTGELVPLLQIAPSKTDTERLLLVSPELADVLSAIICRVRGAAGAVPMIRAYDTAECQWLAPAPLLFQHRVGAEHRPLTAEGIRTLLTRALAHTGLTDPATGGPLRYTPHDFRRLFITDAVLGGLPPHIAQVIAGHRDINVTLGYKAIYPEEAIQAHRAFLARRRALRPSDEYRVPTDAEWQQFLGHFQRRKVSIGTCGRAFGTPCIHEHACVRCPMLWPDPSQHQRLVEIRDNLHARIAEAEREGWLGEVEGLQVSLTGAEEKLAHLARRAPSPPIVDLGLPALTPPGAGKPHADDAGPHPPVKTT